jgi:hypothetical protein
MSQIDFLRHVRAWCEANRGSARDAGVELKFGRSDDERPKPSAWVSAEKKGRIADLTVWSSGEAEFIAGRPGAPDVHEHHELDSAESLDVLLDRLLASLP